MKFRYIVLLAAIASYITVVTAVLAQDRYTSKAPTGIAFSEFRGYDTWSMVASSIADGGNGCGTSKDGCIKSIVGNPSMIKAYQEGFPANGKPAPDGAVLAKIEWANARDTRAPYGVTVPGEQAEVAFMLKDSKRFPDTNGWGYATFQYEASSGAYKPKPGDASFGRVNCHGCHTSGAKKTRDFVYTSYPRR